MTPYEILLSESQERMLLVAKKGTEDEVKRIFDKWDLDAVVIGRVTDDRQFRALFDGVEVACIPISALTKEAPVYQRPVERPKLQDQLEQLDLSNIAEPTDLGSTVKLLHRVTEHRLEGVGLPPVRSFRAQQYGGRSWRRCRSDPAQRNGKGTCTYRRWQ